MNYEKEQRTKWYLQMLMQGAPHLEGGGATGCPLPPLLPVFLKQAMSPLRWSPLLEAHALHASSEQRTSDQSLPTRSLSSHCRSSSIRLHGCKIGHELARGPPGTEKQPPPKLSSLPLALVGAHCLGHLFFALRGRRGSPLTRACPGA